MPQFEACFAFRNSAGQEETGTIPPQKFNTRGFGQKEFWNALFALERKLSAEFGGHASHLVVTAEEDIPECKIKKGEIVAYNSLEL